MMTAVALARHPGVQPARAVLPRAPCLAAGTRRCQDTPLMAARCVRGIFQVVSA